MGHIIGLMLMLGGLYSMWLQNYTGAYWLFTYAFILWVVVAIDEAVSYKRKKKEGGNCDR